jgi:hypothetical protein
MKILKFNKLIYKRFLEEKGYLFILTSRFTQDCLENLFSTVRSKQLIPNALQFKNNLKLITLSQYLKDVSRSSYQKDDREFLADFLDTVNTKTSPSYSNVHLPDSVPLQSFILNNSELNSLYSIGGYLITSIRKNSQTCTNCINSVGSKTTLIIHTVNWLK